MKALTWVSSLFLLVACGGKQPRQTAGLDVFNPVGFEARLNYRRQLQPAPAPPARAALASITNLPRDGGAEAAEAPDAGADAGTAFSDD